MPVVTRESSDAMIDVSGNWNDTDSQLVSKEMIGDSLNRPWLTEFVTVKKNKPRVIVGEVLNKSHEHINTDTFVGDLEREVTNSGKVKGDEIVQLYLNDKIASVTRPVKELKGFERITLEAGQTKTVKFKVDPSRMSFWDYNMKYTQEAGEFDIMVGTNSENLINKVLTVE